MGIAHLPSWLSGPGGYVLGAVAGVLLLVFASLVSAAVSEAVIRVAAWLYSPLPEVRTLRLEEWLGDINEMKPQERPAHAGSLLLVGLKRAPATLKAVRADRSLPKARPSLPGHDADLDVPGQPAEGASTGMHLDEPLILNERRNLMELSARAGASTRARRRSRTSRRRMAR